MVPSDETPKETGSTLTLGGGRRVHRQHWFQNWDSDSVAPPSMKMTHPLISLSAQPTLGLTYFYPWNGVKLPKEWYFSTCKALLEDEF